MNNTFYTSFDTEFFGRGQDKKLKTRTPFEQDRDRIIYSPAFRRLQNKTQVFLSGEYDFYRTRLTHSIEVSQIGRSLCNHLNRSSTLLGPEYCIDQDLVESVCLAHDIGHPSFGHAGEAVFNTMMQENGTGGFEGNAQNLRILVDLFYRSGSEWSGMKPTRAFLDGMLKYKTLFRDSAKKKHHFLYDQQQEVVDFVSGPRPFREELATEEELNTFKSVECQIMDWADDIAYSIHDIGDGIQAGFITVKGVRRWQNEHEDSLNIQEARFVDELCAAMLEDTHSRFLGRLIGEFIRSTTLEERDNFMVAHTNRYRYAVVRDQGQCQRCELLKKMAIELVFHTPQVHQLEYKGGHILRDLFGAFVEEYVNKEKPDFCLLPPHYADAISRAGRAKRFRIICDYISGMTDGFVVRTYKRLFDPDFGSIIDLV